MTTPLDAVARPDTPPDSPPAPEATRLVGHRESPASFGVDLTALFNTFLASLSGQVMGDGADGSSPLGRFACSRPS